MTYIIQKYINVKCMNNSKATLLVMVPVCNSVCVSVMLGLSYVYNSPFIIKTRMTTFIKTKVKISDLESPSNFQVKEEKKYLNRSINYKIGLLWPRESFEGK